MTTQRNPRKRSGYTSGIIMIVLGCIFLAHNYGYPVPANWWAFFVLLPAIPYLARAWALFSRGESRAALQPLVPGLVFCFISMALFFELDWSHVWPLFLILGGLSSIASVRGRASE